MKASLLLFFCGALWWSVMGSDSIKVPRSREEILKDINYDEKKVPSFEVVSPLRKADGTMVASVEEWQNVRRQEILDFYRENVYGKAVPLPDEMRVNILSEKNDALNGNACRKEIELVFKMKNGEVRKAVMLLYTPAKVSGKVPCFVGLNFRGNHTVTPEDDVLMTGHNIDGTIFSPLRHEKVERWQIEENIKRGYAVATLCYHDIFPDVKGENTGKWEKSVYGMFFPEKNENLLHKEYSAIGVWAWSLSRMADVLEKEKNISFLAVIGHSRLGKSALWAGVNDTRFKLVISNDSGHGGAALFKRCFGESVESLCNSYGYWFIRKFYRYIRSEAEMEFDQHFLLSLVAPRALAVGSATLDRWADPKGEFLSALYASSVYKLFGLPGLTVSTQPEPDTPVTGIVSYQLRTGKHDIMHQDWIGYWAAADKFLKN